MYGSPRSPDFLLWWYKYKLYLPCLMTTTDELSQDYCSSCIQGCQNSYLCVGSAIYKQGICHTTHNINTVHFINCKLEICTSIMSLYIICGFVYFRVIILKIQTSFWLIIYVTKTGYRWNCRANNYNNRPGFISGVNFPSEAYFCFVQHTSCQLHISNMSHRTWWHFNFICQNCY